MAFRDIPLAESWFISLDLSALGVRPDQLPDPHEDGPLPWRCVVDEERRVLMTKLLGSTAEMRELRHCWLLAIGEEVFRIESDLPRAWLVGAAGLPLATYERTIGLAMEAWAVLSPRCGPCYRFPPTPPAPPQPWEGESARQQRIEMIRALNQLVELLSGPQRERNISVSGMASCVTASWPRRRSVSPRRQRPSRPLGILPGHDQRH